MSLPADSHVHSEWSWDTGGPSSDARGRMRATCAQAMRIGLPALVFTEHLDIPRSWRADPDDLMPHQQQLLRREGLVDPVWLDLPGYLECVARCRRAFPDLTILTGVEFGQPHLFEQEAASRVDLRSLDRVNGSLHTLAMGAPHRAEPGTLFREHPADDVMWAYLSEAVAMANSSASFDVFTHLDYAVRLWPLRDAGPFDPRRFEEGFRAAMGAIASSGRALEMNTRRLWPWMPQWWAEEGGRRVAFGSDAHTPEVLAANFPEAVAMVEYFGFRPGSRPEDFWIR